MWSGEVASGLEFLAEIGQGSMGQVMLARLLPSRELVAVKRLGSGRLGSVQRSRLQREAGALRRLDQPNIVRLVNLLEIDDELVLVLEYIDGPSLRSLQGVRKLGTPEALVAADHVHRALAHAHSEGVTHRDVKPSNVLVNAQGLCKLTDFGLARLDGIAGSSSGTVLTRPGHPLGTAPYMAPEAVVGATDLDARADLYSFAVMVYELLTGRLPFPSEVGTVALLRAHVSDPVPRPTSFDPAFPPEVEAVLLRSLEKQREQRHESVEEFWQELGAAADRAWSGWRLREDLVQLVIEVAGSPRPSPSAGSIDEPAARAPEGHGSPVPLLPVLDPIPPTFPDLGRPRRPERTLAVVLVGVVLALGLVLALRAFL